MGVDINVHIIIGVKLLSKEELFDPVTVTEFGCKHEVKDSAFCPECGRPAVLKIPRDIPRLPLEDPPGDPYGIKILGKDYKVIYDPERHNPAVYVAVYHRSTIGLNHGHADPEAITQPELEEHLKRAQKMVSDLVDNNIGMESMTPAVFVIPYFS